MKRGPYTRIILAGLLGLMLLTCSSCVYVHTGDMAMSRHEREVPLTAPLAAGSSFSAETGDSLIHANLPMAVEGKIGRSLTGRLGDGEGRVRLRTHDGSITIR